MFRNSIDPAINKRELTKLGIRVVSTSMDLGKSPESAMVEVIMHAVDEYRSKADGADISHKMATKARNGDTLGRAPIGYRNQRDLSEGRNIGTVVIDPERAPLVRAAFELYATGEYSIDQLAEELGTRGLRTRPGRHPSGPISPSKVGELLRDPYYVGFVSYKGELFAGRHSSLVTSKLFDEVQVLLDKRGYRGSRQRRHHHYLKGSLWCGRCHEEDVESRMILQWAVGNGGEYLYFFCRRKQEHLCDSRYVESEAIEAAIVDLYETLQFPTDLADRLRKVFDEALAEEQEAAQLLRQQLRTELARLSTQEENLLDLAADGTIASEKLKERLGKITRQQAAVRERLTEHDESLAASATLPEVACQPESAVRDDGG